MTRERTAQLARVGASYEVVTQSGGQLRFGDAADGGLSPMETLLATLAGCSAMDVHAIAAKKRQRLDRYVVTVVGQQRDEHPRIFIRIDVRHELEGQGLSETAVRRSIELSAGKYCPVNAMLAAGQVEGFVSGRPPRLAGALLDRDALATGIDAGTRLRRRPGHPCVLVDDGDQVRVMIGDRVLRVPARVRPALAHVADHAELTPGDLPLDDESALVLSRRLVREGLLEVVR